MKLCIDCKWYLHLVSFADGLNPEKAVAAQDVCTHEQVRDPVTGGALNRPCSVMRQDGNACGSQGALWQGKPQADPGPPAAA
jgi:hypothetical protein